MQVVHHHHNGLDGKVSRITSSPGPKAKNYEHKKWAEAFAPDLVFYEGNSCKQGIKAALHNHRPGKHSINCKKSKACDNDEIRSMRIYSFVRPHTDVIVYDHPEAETKDDWTKVSIGKPDFHGAPSRCIKSFEKSHSSDGISVKFHKHNGLDGKISHIKIHH